jgi:hypothetical protein
LAFLRTYCDYLYHMGMAENESSRACLGSIWYSSKLGLNSIWIFFQLKCDLFKVHEQLNSTRQPKLNEQFFFYWSKNISPNTNISKLFQPFSLLFLI